MSFGFIKVVKQSDFFVSLFHRLVLFFSFLFRSLRFSLAAVFSLLLVSCGEFFQEPVKGFFEEYTETASIVKYNIEGNYPFNRSGVVCFSNEKDPVIHYYMRNPQRYTLIFDYLFDDSQVSSAVIPESGEFIFTQSTDKSEVDLKFSKDFLYRIDSENIGGKIISGKITLLEKATGRRFENFTVRASANTVPPAALNAAFQLNSPDMNNARYVVCYFLPDTSHATMTLHSKDTHVVKVNGTQRYFDGTGVYVSADTENWTFGNRDESFRTSRPEELTPLKPVSDGGYSFNSSDVPAGYYAVYHVTDIVPTTDNVDYVIRIEDDAGLASEVKISNKSVQLAKPEIQISASDLSTGVIADEDSGFYSLKIGHNGLDVNGSSCGGNVTLNYTVTEIDGKAVFNTGSELSGTSSVPAEILLPRGTYSIRVTASKNYYLASDAASFSDIVSGSSLKVRESAVYYIKDTGDDAGTGKKLSPYRTIAKALESIKGNSDIEPDTMVTIRIMSNLDVSDNISFGMDSIGNAVNITMEPFGVESPVLTMAAGNYISNVGAVSDAMVVLKDFIIQRPSASNGMLIEAGVGKWNLENMVIRNSSASMDTGSIVSIIGDTELTIGRSIIENCQANCIINNMGATRKLNLSETTVRGCTAEKVIANSGTFVMDGASIVSNTITQKANQTNLTGAIVNMGALRISGKTSVTGNIHVDGSGKSWAQNLVTDRTVNIAGNINGSKIGIIHKDELIGGASPYPCVFTSGFKTSGTTEMPSKIFTGDMGFAAGLSADGTEAVVTSSGLSDDFVGHEDYEVRCLTSEINNPSALNESQRTVVLNVYNRTTGRDYAGSVTWNINAKYLGSIVPAEYCRVSGNKIIFSSNIMAGTYTISGTAIVEGTSIVVYHNVRITASE